MNSLLDRLLNSVCYHPLLVVLGGSPGGAGTGGRPTFIDPVASLDGTSDRIILEFFDTTSTYRCAEGAIRKQTLPDNGGFLPFVASKDQMSTYGTWQSHVDATTEQVTNGGFATTSNWTIGGINATIGSGVCTFSGNDTITQTLSTLQSDWYLVSVEVTTATAGTIQVTLGGTASDARTVTTDGIGRYDCWFNLSSPANNDIVVTAAGTANFVIDDVSVKLLPGNHAQAFSSDTFNSSTSFSLAPAVWAASWNTTSMGCGTVNLGEDFNVCLAMAQYGGSAEQVYDMVWNYRTTRPVGLGHTGSGSTRGRLGVITNGNTIETNVIGKSTSGPSIIDTQIKGSDDTVSVWRNSVAETLDHASTIDNAASGYFAIGFDGSAQGSDEAQSVVLNALYAYGNQYGRREELGDFVNQSIGGWYDYPHTEYSFDPCKHLPGTDRMICDFFDLTSCLAAGRDVIAAEVAAATDTVACVLNKEGFDLWGRWDAIADRENVVLDGGFDVGSDWTAGTGVSIGSGVATFAGTTASATLTQNSVFDATGDWYVEFEITAYTSGTIAVSSSGGGASAAFTPAGTGVHKLLLDVTTTGNLVFTGGAAASEFNGSIDNVKVVNTGTTRHLFQGTGSAQPVVRQERGDCYFLDFDGTDDFLETDNSDWTGQDWYFALMGMAQTGTEADNATLFSIDATNEVELQNAAAAVWTPHLSVNDTEIDDLGSLVDFRPRLWEIYADDTSSEISLWRDGEAVVSAAAATIGLPSSSKVRVGADAAGTNFLDSRMWGLYAYDDTGGREDTLRQWLIREADTFAGMIPPWRDNLRNNFFDFDDPTSMLKQSTDAWSAVGETIGNNVTATDTVGLIFNKTRINNAQKYRNFADWYNNECPDAIPDPTLDDQSFITTYGSDASDDSSGGIIVDGTGSAFSTFVYISYDENILASSNQYHIAILELDITAYTSGNIRAFWAGGSGSNTGTLTPTATGKYIVTMEIGSDGTDDGLYLQSSSVAFNGTIGGISLKLVTGPQLEQPTSTRRATWNRDSNGRGYLDFDGTDDCYEGSTGLSMYPRQRFGVVFDPDGTTQAADSTVLFSASLSYEDFQLHQSSAQGGSNWQTALSINAGATTEVWTATGTNDGMNIIDVVVDCYDDDIDVYVDGDIDTTGTAVTMNNSLPNQTRTFFLGATNVSGANPFDGKIYGVYWTHEHTTSTIGGRLSDMQRVYGALDIV